MSSSLNCFGARIVRDRYDDPQREPLVRSVGEELAAGFVWVREIRLRGRDTVQAYHHVVTRRSLSLGDYGGAYEEMPCERFVEVRLDEAIQRCLCPLWLLGGSDEDRALIAAALDRCPPSEDWEP